VLKKALVALPMTGYLAITTLPAATAAAISAAAATRPAAREIGLPAA